MKSEPMFFTIIFLIYFITFLIFLRSRFDRDDPEIAVSNIGLKIPKYKKTNTFNFLLVAITLILQSFYLTKILSGDLISILYVQIVLISGLFLIGLTLIPSSKNRLVHNAFAYLLYAIMSVAYMIAIYFTYLQITPYYIFIASVANLSILLLVLYFIGYKRDYENRMAWNMEWISVILSTFFILTQSIWIYTSL